MASPATHYAPTSRTQSLELLYRSESNQSCYSEKRQLFLRSYQFSRKQSLSERVKNSLIGAKKALCRRLRSVRRIGKVVSSRFRYGFHCRRRRFVRLLHSHNRSSSSSSYCFC